MSSRARTTVASLLMALAVLVGSCTTTASAQSPSGGGLGIGAGAGARASSAAAAATAASGGGGGGGGAAAAAAASATAGGGGSTVAGAGFGVRVVTETALGLRDGPPKVEVEPVKMAVDNRLDCTLRVVLTADALGSPKIFFVAPHKVELIPPHALTPASSSKLTIQALPDKEEYVIVGNAASRGVALTGTLSIVVVKFCESPHAARGLLVKVTKESKLKTKTICAKVDGSPP